MIIKPSRHAQRQRRNEDSNSLVSSFTLSVGVAPRQRKPYARDGISKDCINGVGKSGANFVYAFGGDGKNMMKLCSIIDSRGNKYVIIRDCYLA